MPDSSNGPGSARDVATLPTCRIGYINPLDLIDTCPYEFYRLAPDNAIASMISIGLKGFSGSAAAAAVNENLTHCLGQLAKRQVEFTVLGGLPMLFNLGQDYSAEFAANALANHGLRAGTSIDAVLAAFHALEAKNVVVIDKWDAELNARVASTLEAGGVNLIGAVTEIHTAEQVKQSYEAGSDVALRLAERAVRQEPEMDCLFIAGGAWLVAPFISQIEKEFGIAVVAGQQSKIWYSLNMVDNHVDRPEYGRLLTTRMKVA